MARKMFRFTYARPRQWVKRHEGAIITTARSGGLVAGFAGGAVSAMILRNPLTTPLWTVGTVGGTVAGDIFGRRLARSLETRLPIRTSFKVPMMRMPSTGQVIASPFLVPFKTGEAFGNMVVNRRKRMMAKRMSFVPTRRHSFI